MNTNMADDIDVSTIIIVGCVCGLVVAILVIILAVLCWRRHNSFKQYEKARVNYTNQTPVCSDSSVDLSLTSPNADVVTRNGGGLKDGGVDNPVMDIDISPPPLLPRAWPSQANGNGHTVFTTQQSGHYPLPPYRPNSRPIPSKQPTSPPRHSSHPAAMQPPVYSSEGCRSAPVGLPVERRGSKGPLGAGNKEVVKGSPAKEGEMGRSGGRQIANESDKRNGGLYPAAEVYKDIYSQGSDRSSNSEAFKVKKIIHEVVV